MSRSHDSRYAKPLDPYEGHRCVDCNHIIYADDPPRPRRCRWNYAGTCGCTDHRTPDENTGPEAGAAPTDRHLLIVHEEPDDGMEIEHPDTCPTELVWEGRVLVHTCDVGRVENHCGLGEFFRRTSEAAEGDYDSGYVTPGRYEVEYWEDVVRGGACFPDEVDSGLRLVQGGAS